MRPGISAEIMRSLAEHFNCKIVMVKVPRYGRYELDVDGLFHGLTDYIRNGTIDMSIARTTMIPDRVSCTRIGLPFGINGMNYG